MRNLPTLDQIERRPDGPATRPRRVTDTQLAESRTPVIGSWTDCWCGLPLGHGWTGRDTGTPHP
jgi:hypothetical protein